MRKIKNFKISIKSREVSRMLRKLLDMEELSIDIEEAVQKACFYYNKTIKPAVVYDTFSKESMALNLNIETPAKYYFEDLGLRNARLNFRQNEQPHLMENLIYNELRKRGYSVDVGHVVKNTRNETGKSERNFMEIDFVCNKGYDRIYIQSAYALPTEEKTEQELKPLLAVNDNFQKIVITGGNQSTYRNDDGILILNVFDFLMDEKWF